MNILPRLLGSLFLLLLLTTATLVLPGQAQSLPLRVLEAPGPSALMVVYLTGDGGWNSFSQSLCQAWKDQGYHVVALDSRKYFWQAKTPEALARDLGQAVAAYQKKWKVDQWLLIGYSFGADVAPFVPHRLDQKAVSRPKACILLNPAGSTDFEVKLTDLLGSSSAVRKYNVLQETQKLSKTNTYILFAESEKNPARQELQAKGYAVKEFPGDHYFDQNIPLLVQAIRGFVGRL